MTDEELREIEERANATTPPPWRIDHEHGALWNIETGDGSPVALALQLVGDDIKQSRRSANTEFIAKAREDVPALIAEIRRLRALKSGSVEG